MNAHDEDRIEQLLKQALPPIEADSEPSRDLWPAVLRRLDAETAAPHWFDWALLASLAALIAFFPASIPMLLYNL